MAETLCILATAATFGGMLFFAGVMAPLVFAKLPGPTASAFIRQVFPIYYLVMAGATALAALLATQIQPADTVVLATVSVGFLYGRLGLLPRIDQARSQATANDPSAEARFRRLHRGSTVLNAVQLVGVTVTLIRLVS
jgi:hypothetical protein